MHTADAQLQIDNLSVSYAPSEGVGVRALTDLSLQVRSGEIFGLLGESGSGKSTLAHAILGLLPARATSRGRVLFRDRDLLRLGDRELNEMRGRDLSLIPQDPATSLNPVLMVGTQIAEVLRAHLRLPSHGRRCRVNELLDEMGLDSSVYHAYPHQLSGGQRQRIVIAQALACRPALIIADEPTSKLDSSLRADVSRLFSNIHRKYGATIFIITHDLALIAGIANRIGIMYAGRVTEIADSSSLIRDPLHPYTQALIGIFRSTGNGVEHKQAFPIISGDPPHPTGAAHGCEFEPRCTDRMDACRRIVPREIAPEPSRLVRCLKYEA